MKRLSLLTLIVLILGTAGAAHAGLSPRSSLSNAELQLFWTPEREAHAAATPLLVNPDPLPALGRRVATGKGDDPNQTRFPITWRGWYQSKIVGKIYYVGPNGFTSACSGTVVGPNIVLTAAHCIWEGDFGHSWLFIPDKWGTSEPYGSWSADVAWVPDEWQDSNTTFFPDDYGFLVLKPNSAGLNVSSVVGSGSVLAGVGDGGFFALGYPAAGLFSQWTIPDEHGWGGPVSGAYSYGIYSPYADYWTYTLNDTAGNLLETGYTIAMGNFETGGASGGPWFASYNGQWNGYVVSVNSHCWAPPELTPGSSCAKTPDQNFVGWNMWGPYFGSRIYDDLRYVESLTP